MSKAYLFAIFLLAASFTGCIGGEDLEKITTEKEETTEEEEEKGTIDPVGEDNMTSLRKEIDNLKATITNYEKPKVYFMMDDDNDHLFCDEYGNSCDIIAKAYDVNGVIESYKWESSDPNFDDNHCYLLHSDDKCFSLYNFINLDVCDYEENQIFTLTVYDNDGNSGSASYDHVYSEDLCGPPEPPEPSAPFATFLVEENSDGTYHVEVLQVTEEYNLTEFSFFLKDETGSTYVGGNGFGEIAMQMIAGTAHGIDVSYSDSCDDNCDSRLENRATNVSNDDGSEYPVHFFLDYGLDGPNGKLSAGDKFIVYGTGNSANGPAADNWRLDIQFDATGDIVGSAKIL